MTLWIHHVFHVFTYIFVCREKAFRHHSALVSPRVSQNRIQKGVVLHSAPQARGPLKIHLGTVGEQRRAGCAARVERRAPGHPVLSCSNIVGDSELTLFDSFMKEVTDFRYIQLKCTHDTSDEMSRAAGCNGQWRVVTFISDSHIRDAVHPRALIDSHVMITAACHVDASTDHSCQGCLAKSLEHSGPLWGFAGSSEVAAATSLGTSPLTTASDVGARPYLFSV